MVDVAEITHRHQRRAIACAYHALLDCERIGEQRGGFLEPTLGADTRRETRLDQQCLLALGSVRATARFQSVCQLTLAACIVATPEEDACELGRRMRRELVLLAESAAGHAPGLLIPALGIVDA